MIFNIIQINWALSKRKEMMMAKKCYCDVCCRQSSEVTKYKITNPLFKIVTVKVCRDCRNRDQGSELSEEEFRLGLEEEYADNFKM